MLEIKLTESPLDVLGCIGFVNSDDAGGIDVR